MTNRLSVALAAIEDVRVAPVTKLRVAANENLLDTIDAALHLGVSPSHLSWHKHLLPAPMRCPGTGRDVWCIADIEAARSLLPVEDRYWERSDHRADKPIKKKQIRGKKGTKVEFWRNVDKRSDTEWIWTGRVNNNHNTVDTKNYDYGVFSLEGCGSELVHRVMIYLTYGRELTRAYDVFNYDGNHLNIHLDNLGIRSVKTRREQSASDHFAIANDNHDGSLKVAA